MQNLRLRGRPPPIIFARIVKALPYNFVADSFHTKKHFVADFLQAKCDFKPKTAVWSF